MLSVLGISITKCNLKMDKDHIQELESKNLMVKTLPDKYVVCYKPQPLTDNKELICYIKCLLTTIRNDDIYNSYNNDFGIHNLKIKPIIKVKN